MGKLLILILVIATAVGFYVYQSPTSAPEADLTAAGDPEPVTETNATAADTEQGEGVFSHLPGFVETAREGQQAADRQQTEMDRALQDSN